MKRPTLLIGTYLVLQFLGPHQVLATDLIYKSTEPNGKVTYSWKPVPDAIRVKTLEVQAPSREQRQAMKQFQEQEAANAKASQAAVDSLEVKWSQVEKELADAQAGLQMAEAALEKGREPRPGERLGNARGGTRLTQAYFYRIHELELAAARAKERLDKAYDARNELR